MEKIIIIIFSLITVISGLIYISWSLGAHKTIYLIDWAYLVIILLYGIGFPLVYFSSTMGRNPSGYSQLILQFTTPAIIYYYLLILFFMLAIFIGWHSTINENIRYRKINNSPNKTEYQIQKYVRKHIKFAWLMLLISFVFYYIYSMAYGGLLSLLKYSISIRSGIEIVSNRFSFFQKFGQFSLIATYVFYSIYIDYEINKKDKKGTLIGLICSSLFSVFYLYSLGGRGSMMFFFLILFLITTYYHSERISVFIKNISRKIIWLPVMFLALNTLWNRTSVDSLFSLFVSTISYPFGAFIVNFKEGSYRFFKDFIYGPFYFLPSSIWSEKLNMTTANDQTTYLVSGAYKGDSISGVRVTGTSPNDILSFSYMQFDILGVIVVGLLFGFLLKKYHIKINEYKLEGLKWMLYSYFIVRFVLLVIIGGDIAQIIIGNWGFIIYVVLFKIYNRVTLSSIR